MNTQDLITYFEALAIRYEEKASALGLSVEREFHYTTEKLQRKEEMAKDTPYFDAEIRFKAPISDKKNPAVYPLGVFVEIDEDGNLTEEVEEELAKMEEEIEGLFARLDGKDMPIEEFLLATKERDTLAKAQYRAIMREAFPPLKTALSILVPLFIILGFYLLVRLFG